MRVLHPWNQNTLRCGIANFAEQWSTALRRAGAEVTDWNADYSTIYARREAEDPAGIYLPVDAAEYDVIILGWHPGALNYYTADHFPPGPLLCLYLHDIPPWSRCPFEDRADLLITSEPHPDKATLVLPYPVIDWVEDLPSPNEAFTVGWTGVRGDGLEELREVCEKEGYQMNFSDPGKWLSIEEEVRRLARSTVNVCWYREGRGLSGAASTCLASKRPLIINGSPMLQHLPSWLVWSDLERALDAHVTAAKLPWPNKPFFLAAFSWSHAATTLLTKWEEARRVR